MKTNAGNSWLLKFGVALWDGNAFTQEHPFSKLCQKKRSYSRDRDGRYMPKFSVYICIWIGVLDVMRITDDVASTKVG
jgi:hypothetical protein